MTGIDKKTTALDELTTTSNDDLFLVVNSPGSTPVLKKITKANLFLVNNSGWIPVEETWTYASPTTINVPAGATAIYSVGDKIRYQNNDSGTYLYDYVIAVASTLLTVVGNAVPNATLTDAYYSKGSSPVGFPKYFDWTPTFTGFSADPTSLISRFYIINSILFFTHYAATSGTSNATTFTMTVPVVSANISGGIWNFALDNSALLTNPGRWTLSSGSNLITIYSNSALGVWTDSGGKRVSVNGFYQI